ncbi:BnaCnng70820D [Brassica napus]|uniref:(rape) hypothetical protein n=1 Tax=Brassica napus TaxID=3708 RepID=A0A078JTU8_BRANA|nr:unnamed protein product [Brassica napus]CDY70998.1 BnaCnng70820D [Brassica napus]
MAETATLSSLKRHRDEQEQETIPQEDTKKQKPSSFYTSYNQVQFFLDDAEAGNDLTSLITTLQQELSTEEQNAVVFEIPALSSSSCSSSSSCASKDEEYESDKEKMMKHLLEASDDELGIPNIKFGESNYEVVKNESNQDYVNGFSLLDGFGDGLLELEDEAANYYTLLQSELFM